MKTFLKVFLFILIILAGFTGIAIYWTFYKPLPDYNADLSVSGLRDSVNVYWDNYGTPHINAENRHDLYFSVGYVHAQDRLWQMTIIQLAAQGRLAEFFGKDLVPIDKEQRLLGFWRMAKKIEPTLSAQVRSDLQAYSDGVNAWIDANQNKLPIEFSLTGIKPIHWDPLYSIAFSRMLAWQLNVSWWSKPVYEYLSTHLTSNQLSELFPTWPTDAPTTLNVSQSRQLSSSLIDFMKQDLATRHVLGNDGSHVGSNAWVIDGKKSGTGFPILAGDPHLHIDIPGDWYQVHMSLNGRNISGATHPGAPYVILGQNDFLAWSLTNIMADDTDFFVEQTRVNDRGFYVTDSLVNKNRPKGNAAFPLPKDGSQVVKPDSATYKPFKIEREVIKVKDSDDVIFDERFTDHGPVISDILPGNKLLGDKVISMRWTGYDISHELRAFMNINWASSFEDFQKALPDFGVPGQNFMYADRTGNIAMFSAGKIPIRNFNPLLFRNGWDPGWNWKGYIPFNKMPHVINPKEGWIANANNRITTGNYPYYLTYFWEPPSRIETIDAFLSSHDTLGVNDFKKLQNSVFSTQAEQVTKEILPVLENASSDTLIAKALPYLKNWDYKYETSETAASIFDVFFSDLTKNTLSDEMGDKAYKMFTKLQLLPYRVEDNLLVTADSMTSFFDDISTPEVETKDEIILKSMRQAIQFLSDSLGNKPLNWRWERLHTITFQPILFGRAAKAPGASTALKMIVNNILAKGPYPARGNGVCVSNGEYSWQDPYQMILGPSIRRIVDFSDPGNIWSILPAGESGNPLSDHYDDQMKMWLKGQYRVLSQNMSIVKSQPHKTMRLAPGKNN